MSGVVFDGYESDGEASGDCGAFPIVQYVEDEGHGQLDDVYMEKLQEEAVSAQRLVVSRLGRQHMRGAMEVASDTFGRKLVPQRMFRVPKLISWTGGDPDVVVEAMRQGRLRARVSATMGVGKSTKLAPYIARTLNQRVLYVSLDALAIQQVTVYVRQMGLGSFRRDWTTEVKERLTAMTYADFWSIMTTSKRAGLFASFDTIIFDESFVGDANVYAAKCAFAVHADATTNLLLCSATIRSDLPAAEIGSAQMGKFKQISGEVTLDEAIRTGKLVGDYLVDGTLVLLPSEMDMVKLARHYSENGVDCKMIDAATNFSELTDVCTWLVGDASTPRVVVAHSSFYIGFNLPVAYTIIWAQREIVKVQGDEVVAAVVPFSEEMVAQAKARTGRGLIEGSGGVVMTESREAAPELYEDQKHEAFLKLIAAGIEPLKNGAWEECWKMFPSGLTAYTAHAILKCCIPVQVAARYLGSDGKIARRYAVAMNIFAHPDHYLVPSVDEFPVGHDEWRVDRLGGYAGCPSDGKEFKVPVVARGELRVIIHALEMIAEGDVEVPRWRPKGHVVIGQDEGSDDESVRKSVWHAPILRRIADAPIAPVVKRETPRMPWAYGQSGHEPERRSGGVVDPDRFKEALLELEAALGDYKKPDSPVARSVDAGEVVIADESVVVSPGGSVVCTLSTSVCSKMNEGEPLSAGELEQVVARTRYDRERFVTSRMFDTFSGPWDSILRALMNTDVVAQIRKDGFASYTYELVNVMSNRFSVEVISILSQSNVFKRSYWGLFSRRPSIDRLMREVRRGSFSSVAQTRGFIDRVKQLKESLDVVLVVADTMGLYLPRHITAAQRALPLRGNNVVGVLGSDVAAMPSAVAGMTMGGVRRSSRSRDYIQVAGPGTRRF